MEKKHGVKEAGACGGVGGFRIQWKKTGGDNYYIYDKKIKICIFKIYIQKI